MNERIKHLAEQALREVTEHGFSDKVYRPDGFATSASKAFADRFAELIVRECAGAVDTVYENAEPDRGCYDWATWAYGSDVLAHFGLEE